MRQSGYLTRSTTITAGQIIIIQSLSLSLSVLVSPTFASIFGIVVAAAAPVDDVVTKMALRWSSSF